MKIPFLIATSLAVGAVAAPAALAAPSGTVYEVTVNGTQQFDQVDTEVADPDGSSCFDARGTSTQKTVATFESEKPVRMKVVRSGKQYRLVPVRESDRFLYDWPLKVSFTHSGSVNREVTKLDCKTWVKVPPPTAKNCSATFNNYGGSLSSSTISKSGKVEFIGGEDLPMPGSPFDGCPWGDMSLGIYRAKGKINPSVILSSVASAFTLKGTDEDTASTPDGDSTDWFKRTTVRIKFKRVKG